MTNFKLANILLSSLIFYFLQINFWLFLKGITGNIECCLSEPPFGIKRLVCFSLLLQERKPSESRRSSCGKKNSEKKKSGSNLFQKSSQVRLVRHQVERQTVHPSTREIKNFSLVLDWRGKYASQKELFFSLTRDYFPDTCSCTCCTILSSRFHFHKI